MGATNGLEPNDAVNARAFADTKFGAQAVERLRAAFARSRHPMLIADDERRWSTGNSAASELLGIPREEIPWHTMDEFTSPSEHERLARQWQAFLASGSAEGWYRLAVPGRGSLTVEISATANVLPGRHLTVFILPDETNAVHTGSASNNLPSWKPVEEGTERQQLTEREREVMGLIASGLQTDDVATRLFISPETVKSHVHNALPKLGAHTRAHAVAVALVTGQIAWRSVDDRNGAD